jgi:hypothetical protein
MQSIGDVLDGLMLKLEMECGGRGGDVCSAPPPATGQTGLPANMITETRTGFTRKSHASSHEITPANGQAWNAARSVTENGQKGPGVGIPASKQGGDPTRSKARVPPTLMLVSKNSRTAPATRHCPASAVRLFLVTVNGVRLVHSTDPSIR